MPRVPVPSSNRGGTAPPDPPTREDPDLAFTPLSGPPDFVQPPHVVHLLGGFSLPFLFRSRIVALERRTSYHSPLTLQPSGDHLGRVACGRSSSHSPKDTPGFFF